MSVCPSIIAQTGNLLQKKQDIHTFGTGDFLFTELRKKNPERGLHSSQGVIH